MSRISCLSKDMIDLISSAFYAFYFLVADNLRIWHGDDTCSYPKDTIATIFGETHTFCDTKHFIWCGLATTLRNTRLLTCVRLGWIEAVCATRIGEVIEGWVILILRWRWAIISWRWRANIGCRLGIEGVSIAIQALLKNCSKRSLLCQGKRGNASGCRKCRCADESVWSRNCFLS